MPRLNLPLAFAELLIGAVVLDAAIKGASIADVVKGQAKQSSIDFGGGSGGPAGSAGNGKVFSADATGSRLDQGQDLTSSSFGSPFAGTVVQADAHNGGWKGGGVVAVRNDSGQIAPGIPTDVIYFAEGLLPTVHVGQHVQAGEQIATPVANPYNGVVGNIEWGPADPKNPSRPLAQVVADARGMVLHFYSWARSLGAPVSSNTVGAGAA